MGCSSSSTKEKGSVQKKTVGEPEKDQTEKEGPEDKKPPKNLKRQLHHSSDDDSDDDNSKL